MGLARRRRRLLALAVVVALLVIPPAAAGAPGDATASRVADINPGDDEPAPGPDGSTPSNLFNAGGTLLFAANDGIFGTELWKSNGGPLGPGGTELIDPLSQGGIASGAEGSNPAEFTEVGGGTVLFAAQEAGGPSSTGRELWKIEPPYTTPELVEDINATDFGASSSPEQLTNVNGTLFFAADNGVNGNELWKSMPPYDAGSTMLVKDINSTPDASESSDLEELVEVNGTLFLSANNGINGQELWKSVSPYGATDTTLVKDINTTPDVSANSFPAGFENRSGDIFFNADDGVAGQELWKTDGTGPGTTMVTDINPAPGGSNPDEITNVNGTLFFSANGPIEGRELWKSDGTGPGTAVVADINPTVSPSNPQEITNLNGTLIFRASDGATGTELWKSNGGPLGAGTEMVADISPGASPASSIPSELTVVAGQVFFRADNGSNGQELWKSTGAGATMVGDINSTPDASEDSQPQSLTDVNGTLFFRANDGVTGRELWKATIEPAPPPPPASTPATTTPVEPFDLKAAIKKCKKKFPGKAKAKKRKKCIKKAKAKARA